MRLRTPVRRAAGFTFVELGLIIVVIGIVAACAAPRFFDDRTFLHRGYYEELAAAGSSAPIPARVSRWPWATSSSSG